MKVRCINNKAHLTGVDIKLTVGKVYEVLGNTLGDYYCVEDDVEDRAYYRNERFEIVEEEKVEQVKIIRKMEDLIGEKNDRGLVIRGEVIIREGDFVRIIVVMFKGEGYYEFEYGEPKKKDLEFLEAIGFEFEYKQLRTVEEVLDEIRKNGKPFSCDNDFVVSYTKKYGWSAVTLGRDIIGNCYFREDIAEAYVKELNEIIGV